MHSSAVPSFTFCCGDKHKSKGNLKRLRMRLTYGLQSTERRNQSRIPRPEPGDKNWNKSWENRLTGFVSLNGLAYCFNDCFKG